MPLITGTSGPDTINAGPENDEIHGGDGNDLINANPGDDLVYGAGGSDTIEGSAGSDTLDGGAGDDSLRDGGGGDDRLIGGSGNDSISFAPFSGANPRTRSGYIDGGDGDDRISFDGGHEPVIATGFGGSGSDSVALIGAVSGQIDLGDGADSILLYEQRGSLSVTLGAGSDTIKLLPNTGVPTGSPGLVTIQDFNPAQDHLTSDNIIESFRNWNGQNPFTSGHLRLVQDGAATELQVDWDGAGTLYGYAVLLRFEHLSPADLSQVNFFGYLASGTAVAGQTLMGTANGDFLQGSKGADSIAGLGGADVIYGGAGNDTIDGGDGDDVILGETGDDILHGGAGDDNMGGSENDQIFGDAGNDTLSAGYYPGVAGTTMLDGGPGSDFLGIYFGANNPSPVAKGGDGNDSFLVSGSGHATLDGGAGDDQFVMQNADGVSIIFGVGSDSLSFDPSRGSSKNILVQDFQPGASGDRLDLLAYLDTFATGWDRSTNPFAAGYLRFNDVGASTTLQIKGANGWADLVTLQNVTSGLLRSENLSGYGADGSTPGLNLNAGAAAGTLTGGIGPDVIVGGSGGDSLQGDRGNDTLTGGAGDDTLDGGLGSDVVHGGDGADRVFDLSAGGDSYFGDAGDDNFNISRQTDAGMLLTADMGDGNDILSYGASVSGAAQLFGGAGNDQLRVSGNVLSGSNQVSLDAGPGDDVVILEGSGAYQVTLGPGADTLDLRSLLSIGSERRAAEVIDFNVAEDHLRVSNSQRVGQLGVDTVIQVSGYSSLNEWITLAQLDGANALAVAAKLAQPVAVWMIGSDASETLSSGVQFSQLDGGGGDDSLSGQNGADTLAGGGGNDTANGGAGNDSITDPSGQNYLRGGDGDDSISGGSGFDDSNGNMGNDTIHGNGGDDYSVGGKGDDLLFGGSGNDIVWGNLGNDTCSGGDGADQVRGGQGDDLVFGDAGEDFVSGDRGNDTESGGAGAHIFHGSQDAGIDRVLDFKLAEGDRVQLDPGTTYTVSQLGADTVIDMGGANRMILMGVQFSTLTPGWIFLG